MDPEDFEKHLKLVLEIVRKDAKEKKEAALEKEGKARLEKKKLEKEKKQTKPKENESTSQTPK